MDIEEGFSPIERAATMSIPVKTVQLSALQNALVETGLYSASFIAQLLSKKSTVKAWRFSLVVQLFACVLSINNNDK
jgi:hypothetical protein